MPEYILENLKIHHDETDNEENLKSSPSGKEEVRIQSVWVFEVYSPKHMKNLTDGIIKNSIDIHYNKRHPGKDLIDMIEQKRQGISGRASWLNIGYLADPEEASFQMIPINLPEEVSSVHINLLQYIPSITILSYQFILSDKISKKLHEILSKTYDTKVEKHNSTYRYLTPIQQKKNKINIAKNEIHNKCFDWIKNKIPGMFSEINYDFPTCDFITLKEEKPFINDFQKPYESYLNILELNHQYNSWQCKELPSLYLKLFSDNKGILSNANITCNIDELFSSIDNINAYGGKNKFGISNYLQHLDKSLVIWVLYTIVKTYKYHLSNLRDEVAKIDISEKSQKNIEKINKLKKRFAMFQNNIPYFIKEINKYETIDSFPFRADSFKFIMNWDSEREKNRSLFDDLLKILTNDLVSLSNQYENVRKSIFSIYNIISAMKNDKISKENLKMQKNMLLMTGLMLILTALMFLYNINN